MTAIRQTVELALRDYDIVPTRITPAAESFNTVFRVKAVSQTYALRVGSALVIHAGGTLQAESDWMQRLSADGITVPTVLPTRHGEVGTDALDSVGRRRTCAVFDWIPGRSLHGRLTAPNAAALGRLSASLHLNAGSWAPDPPPTVLVADDVLYWRLPNRLTSPSLPGGSVFRDALQRTQTLLAELWQTPPHRPHLLHGDLTPTNVIVSDGGLVPIDFQDMVWGFDIQDLSITVAALRRFAGWERLVEAFQKGYSSLRPWPNVHAATFDGLLAARTLNQVNLTLNLHDPIDRAGYLAARAEQLAGWLQSGHMPA